MIQLTERLVMTADEHCYIVGEPRQRAGRPLGIKKPTYYSTAAQAVQGALKRTMRKAVEDGEVTTLREFIEKQERLLTELEALIAPLEGGKARQNVVEGRVAAKTGKDIPQPPDGEKEAHT